MKFYVLDGIDYGQDLNAPIDGAPDFKYGEFVSSETAVRHGIANIPTEEEWQNIEYLARTLLQPTRSKVGRPLKVNSGFRCKKLNDLVGSSDTSFHRKGCAVDADSDEVPLIEIIEVAISLPHTEIIAEYFPNGWAHLAVQKGRSDQVLKLKDDRHNFAHIDFETLKRMYA